MSDIQKELEQVYSEIELEDTLLEEIDAIYLEYLRKLESEVANDDRWSMPLLQNSKG